VLCMLCGKTAHFFSPAPRSENGGSLRT